MLIFSIILAFGMLIGFFFAFRASEKKCFLVVCVVCIITILSLSILGDILHTTVAYNVEKIPISEIYKNDYEKNSFIVINDDGKPSIIRVDEICISNTGNEQYLLRYTSKHNTFLNVLFAQRETSYTLIFGGNPNDIQKIVKQ